MAYWCQTQYIPNSKRPYPKLIWGGVTVIIVHQIVEYNAAFKVSSKQAERYV